MKKGIIYVVWDPREPKDKMSSRLSNDMTREITFSITCARKTGLPICGIIEEGSNLDLNADMFDIVIHFNMDAYRDMTNHWLRKLRMFELSPFAHTLFLDTDAFIVNPNDFELNPIYPPQLRNPNLDFAFKKAARRGIALAHDGHVMYQEEFHTDKRSGDRHIVKVCEKFPILANKYLGPKEYLPLYNFGVVFFNKNCVHLQEAIAVAKEICILENCDEQIATTIAFELMHFEPYILEAKVWNCRVHDGDKLRWPGARIIHNPTWFKCRRQL